MPLASFLSSVTWQLREFGCPWLTPLEMRTAMRRPMYWVLREHTNWNEVLSIGNAHYDRLVEAYQKPIGRERIEALQEFYDDEERLTTGQPIPRRYCCS